MSRNNSRPSHCFVLMVLVLVVCAPSAAQYSDRLGGNWNNPASAMITNIIMDRRRDVTWRGGSLQGCTGDEHGNGA